MKYEDTRVGLEVCAPTLSSVEAARRGGAIRIELCTALASDGVTPSMGMIKEAIKICGQDVDLHVLFRPREGNFVYTEAEIEATCEDIARFASIAPHRAGIVIGALREDRSIDVKSCEKMVRAAGDKIKNITFHRAFDRCKEPFQAVEEIIELGCNRILTSGQASNAFNGIPVLKQLVDMAGDRISIMAAGGVNSNNARQILRGTGVRELHGSCRRDGLLDSNVEEVRAVAHFLA